MKKENRKIKIYKADYSDPESAGMYHPPLVIENARGKRFKLSAGYSDEIDIFRVGDCTAVLTTNYGLDYAGLEVFNWNDDPCAGPELSFFTQDINDLESAADEVMRRPFFDYTPRTQAEIIYYLMTY